jgi:hypothetical protein
VSEGWPEAIRQELGALNAEKSLIALPVGEVGAALKMGKVAFAWKQIRAWLNPAPQPGPSPHDAAILELPLNMIAPLFMAKRKPVASRKAVAVDENIPDLFTADGVRPSLESTVSSVAPTPVAETPVPSAPAPIQAPTPQPAATSPPAGDPRSVPASIPGRQARDLGELFGQPAKKSWTPQEIVEGTVRMKGVGGALLVLPDGLLVAARVPEGFRTETVAAFMPQILGRMSQYASELQPGQMGSLGFVIDRTPWQFYKAGDLLLDRLMSKRRMRRRVFALREIGFCWRRQRWQFRCGPRRLRSLSQLLPADAHRAANEGGSSSAALRGRPRNHCRDTCH